MFNLNIEKEIIPYQLYNAENITKRIIPIYETLKYVKPKDHAQFIKNIEKQNFKLENDTYDIINKYSRKCYRMDCNVLEQGYNTFRTWVHFKVGIDVNIVLTISSPALQFFNNEG